MLQHLIPSFNKGVLGPISGIAPKGFVLAYAVLNTTPSGFFTSFPEEWRDKYLSSKFTLFDPVLLWGATHTGRKRWSEITLLGMTATNGRVMTAAKDYGLNYGAIFVARSKGVKSFLSAAREDREFSEAELDTMEGIFTSVVSWLDTSGSISPDHRAVLEALADGHSIEETAALLSISVRTAKRRLDSIKSTLGAKTIPQVIHLATLQRLISPPNHSRWY